MTKTLTQAGREELAIAIILWKDFKSQGRPPVDVSTVKQALDLAAHCGVMAEFEAMMSKLPPMKITPR